MVTVRRRLTSWFSRSAVPIADVPFRLAPGSVFTCAGELPIIVPPVCPHCGRGKKPRVLPAVEQKDRWTGQRRRFITKGRSAAVFCSLKRLPAVCGGGICPHDSAGGAPGSTANPGSTELRRCPRAVPR